jgi:flagellar FliJ protein
MDRRSKRLDRVVMLAALEERNECLEMKKSQQALDKAETTLADLLASRQGYESGPAFFGSFDPVRWQDFRRFLCRLDQAVVAQNELIVNRTQQLQAHRQRWQAKRKRVEMLEQIRQRYLRAEADRDERQIQKVLDDLRPMEQLFGA